MVSRKGDLVLSYDSGGIVVASAFYSRNVVCGIHLVCVPEGCKEYLFQFYLHSAILRGDVLLGRMGVGWSQMGDKAQSGVCVHLCDAPMRGVWSVAGEDVPCTDGCVGIRNACVWNPDIQKI